MNLLCRFVGPVLGTLVLLATCTTLTRAQAPCTITIDATDSGSYDVFGEHDSRSGIGVTGLSVENRIRGPHRSYMVFRIPPFTGVLTNAWVGGYSYSIGPGGSQTLNLHEVTNAAAAVQAPGFSNTSVYADLGDGPVYGSYNFPSGFEYVLVNVSNALSTITSARGQDFVMGGDQFPLSGNPLFNEAINFPYAQWSPLVLQLEVSVPNAPLIHTQPAPSNLFSNDAVVTIGACGAEPLTYNWYVNGTNFVSNVGYPNLYFGWIEGTNSPVFVVVTNSFGSVTSEVTIVRRAAVRLEWAHTNVVVRTDSQFYQPIQILAYNTHFPTVTWRKDGAPYNNPNLYSLSFQQAQPSDSGDYTVVASNFQGMVTSAVLRLSVQDVAPRFWEQPRDVTNTLGNYAALGVSAPGGPQPTFRWYRDGVLLPSTNGAQLSFSDLQFSHEGNYHVVASNRAGMATSTVARLEVIVDPPVFLTQPASVETYAGHFVNLFVGLGGSPYPNLQWYFNGEPIPGAWYANLPLGNIQPTNAGAYFCVASNASGVSTSEIATVTVLAVPPIIAGPDDATGGAGHYIYLTALVSNPPACMQWYANGVAILGSTACMVGSGSSFPYTLPILLGHSNYTAQITVVASNAFGFATSRVASVTATTAPPSFIYTPPNLNVLEGSTVAIPTYAAGAPPPQMYLYRNGQDAGAFFNGSLYLFNVTPAQSGEYVLFASNKFGTATSAPFRIDVQRLGPLDRWTRRHPAPQGNDLHAMVFGQNRYVAVGDAGTIITSTNATNWSVFSADVPAELESITYGAGQFVAVGRSLGQGVIVTSTNGENWISRNLSEANSLRGITYGDGKFFVVGNAFGIPVTFVSSNALDWTQGSFTTGGAPFDVVTYGNGRFVIGDDFGTAHSSADLVEWTNRSTSVANPEGLTFFNGHFTMVGNSGRMATSADGVNWTSVTNGATTRRLHAVAYGAGLHVAVGVRGTIISSVSGNELTWTLENSLTDDRLEDVVYGDGLFVAVGERGTIVTSYDGHQWTEQTRGVARDLDDLAVSSDLAIAVGKGGTILTSTDGSDWTLAPLPVPLADSPVDWHGAAFGDSKIVVVGDSTNVLVSTDQAASWQPHHYQAGASYLKSVIYRQGLWVAVGIGGVIVTSRDATNWTQQYSTTSYDLNDITYGHGYFVVVGDQFPSPGATILVSGDGTNWVNFSYALSKNARAITFEQGHYVLAGNDGRFLVTTNALNWGPPSYSYYTYDGANHRDVSAHDRTWIAVGNNGIIVTAPSTFTNGVGQWKPRQSRTAENLHGVRYFKGTFLAVGNRGLILQSGLLDSRLEIERDGTNLNLFFTTPHEGVYRLQETTDFQWQNTSLITNSFGTVRWTVPSPSSKKFYRVVPQ